MGFTINAKPDTDMECIHFKNVCFYLWNSTAIERLDPYQTGIFITKFLPYLLFILEARTMLKIIIPLTVLKCL
jgi:hypothetical protein